MPLTKKTLPIEQDVKCEETDYLPMNPAPMDHPMRHREMTKDDYWRRREERDVERDKHMAWSGLAQAALTSVSVAQLNVDNTKEGLVKLVAEITNLLLKERDSK